MALIANRVTTKSHLAELFKLLLFGLRKSVSVLLIVICLGLLFNNSKHISSVTLEVVGRVVDMGAIVYKSVFEKTSFVINRFSYYRDLELENTRLKIELSKMRDSYIKAQVVMYENESLKKALHVVEKTNSIFLTTKLLSVSSTPFASTAIIGAGSNDKVEIDDVVASDGGLVGRVIAVSPNYATVRLLDDFNSRIPVITSITKTRGILARQDDHLKIIYVDNEDNNLELNETIYTSGDGKVFPDAIKIGNITEISSFGVIVAPHSDLKKLDYVYIQKVNN